MSTTEAITFFYQDRINRTLLANLSWQPEHLQNRIDRFFGDERAPRDLLLQYASREQFPRWQEVLREPGLSAETVENDFLAAVGFAALLAKRDSQQKLLVEFTSADILQGNLIEAMVCAQKHEYPLLFCGWYENETDLELLTQFFAKTFVIQRDDPLAVEILFSQVKALDVVLLPNPGDDVTSKLLWLESIRMRYERAMEDLCN